MRGRWLKPSLKERLAAELALHRQLTPADIVVCPHSMPTLLRAEAHICVIMQNRLLLQGTIWLDFISPRRWPHLARRALLRAVRHHADEYVVQTPSMLRALRERFPDGPPSRVMPFLDRRALDSVGEGTRRFGREFLYVADGMPHKNHLRLLEAWVLLAAEGIRPGLTLTLGPRDHALLAIVEQARERHGLVIENVGCVPRDELLQLYGTARALIYPSVAESYGLPLVEAGLHGLPVIASELDFVRDVCRPVETFDPASSVSIARAVRRFLGLEEPTPVFQSVRGFAKYLLGQRSTEDLSFAA
jgi:glycosyltransferase involved in cell wall biosynthesis